PTLPFVGWIAKAGRRALPRALRYRHGAGPPGRLEPPMRLQSGPHGSGRRRGRARRRTKPRGPDPTEPSPPPAERPARGGLFHTIAFPLAQSPRFAGTARAMGLSLNPIVVRLALLLGTAAAPGRSTVQRWVQAAGTAAGAGLKRLDQADTPAHPLARLSRGS